MVSSMFIGQPEGESTTEWHILKRQQSWYVDRVEKRLAHIKCNNLFLTGCSPVSCICLIARLLPLLPLYWCDSKIFFADN